MAVGALFDFHTIRLIPVLILANIFTTRIRKFDQIYFYAPAVLLYFLAVLVTSPKHSILIAELIRIASGFIVIFVLNTHLRNERQYVDFKRLLFSIIYIVIFSCSILALYKFMMLAKGIVPSWVGDQNRYYLPGSTLNTDYNLFSLAMIFGILSSKYIFDNAKKWFLKAIIPFSQICISGSIDNILFFV